MDHMCDAVRYYRNIGPKVAWEGEPRAAAVQ